MRLVFVVFDLVIGCAWVVGCALISREYANGYFVAGFAAAGVWVAVRCGLALREFR